MEKGRTAAFGNKDHGEDIRDAGETLDDVAVYKRSEGEQMHNVRVQKGCVSGRARQTGERIW